MHARPTDWFWLLILAVLCTRLVGIHLHFCFDGQEPQASMHTGDGSIHNDADHAGGEHTDQDVDVLDASLAKLGDRAFNLPLLFVACVLLPPLILSLHNRLYAATDPVPHSLPPRLLPPLRGPPR